MTEELVLVNESVDEVGSVEHVRSMAHNRAKVKGLWTLAQASQFMEHSRFAYQNTVNLSGFVTLTLAEFVTPKQVTHGLVVDSEGNVLKLNLGSHVCLSHLYAYSMAQLRAVVSM